MLFKQTMIQFLSLKRVNGMDSIKLLDKVIIYQQQNEQLYPAQALFVHMMINTILTPALTVASSESRSQGSGRCFLVKSTRYCFLVKFTLKKVVSDNIRAGIPAFLCSLYNSVLVIRIFNISLLTIVYAIIHSLTLRAFSFKWDKKC
ncbi:hypothetical protein EC930624_A0006, partial [Escherichia coli 93.0624]